MRTLLILLRTEFLSLVNSMNRKGKTPFIIAAVGLALLGLFMIAMFGIIGASTAYTLVKKDLPEFAIFVSLSLSMIIALMFGVMNSTRDARSSDTDMLLSMPIPKSSIVISKLLGMYLLDVLCAAVMILPSTAIVCLRGPGSEALFLRSVLIVFLVPALPLFISLLIGSFISFLRKATKFGQIAATFLSFAVLMVYMIVVPNLSGYAEKLDITPAEALSKMKAIPPFYWITEAVYSGDALCLLLTVLITVIPMVLAVYIHARGLNGVDFHADNSKKARTYKSASPRKAVITMEFRRYFSSMNYIMNTLVGSLFLVAATVFLLIKGMPTISVNEAVEMNGQTIDIASRFSGAAWALVWSILIMFFASITYTTPPSVSLEGKRIWLNKSLPISTRDILFSKLIVSIMIFQPISIICSIVLSIISGCGIAGCLLLIVLTSLAHLLFSMVGLIFGLVFVRLDWTNEAQVIKSGMGLVITMIVNFFLALFLSIGLFVAIIIGGNTAIFGAFAGEIILVGGLCAGAYAIITHYGVKKYESLNG
ncbi:MAG: hypothetical protein J6Y58_08365 [Clostridiales bacterium]|nr:hypothetical protein [Clostridiales bacterium]